MGDMIAMFLTPTNIISINPLFLNNNYFNKATLLHILESKIYIPFVYHMKY